MTIRAQTPARDHQREREFLAAAAARSGLPDFVEHARSRLEQGDREFRDRWTRLSTREFLHELREEAADLGAWAALAEQRLEQTIATHAVAALLHEIAAAGARAHRLTLTADELLHGRAGG